MVLRLIRALPGEAAFLAPVAGGNFRQRSARVAAHLHCGNKTRISSCHCEEPTGRANARPMTGSVTTLLRLLRKLRRAGSPPKLGERRRKQSIVPRAEKWIAWLAMTWFRFEPSYAPKASFLHSRLSRQPVGATVGYDAE